MHASLVLVGDYVYSMWEVRKHVGVRREEEVEFLLA